MSGIQVVTPSAITPVTNTEAKDYLKIVVSDDDTLVTTLVKTATTLVEQYLNRSLITKTLRLSLDSIAEIDLPLKEGIYTAPYHLYYDNYIELPFPPLLAVQNVKFFNDGDVESTWAVSNYYVDNVREMGRIVLRDGGSYPTDLRHANGIQVNYTAGYGSATTDVPEPIRLAILQYVVHLYEHRGDSEGKQVMLPAFAKTLLQPYQIVRYGNNPYNKKYSRGY